MRKIVWIISLLCLLALGTLCALRWEAWFVSPPPPQWQGDTLQLSLKTFAADSVRERLQKDNLEFLILGDVHGSMSKDDYRRLLIRHPNIDFVAQLGDWIERPYLYHEQEWAHTIQGSGFDSIPLIAIPGNHEHQKGVFKQLGERWTQIFTNPQNGPTRFLGSTYYIDFPRVRVIAINTDGLNLMSDYTQVCFWLKNCLMSATDRLTIVLMHHPVFSTAEGRQNPLMWLFFYGPLRQADIVFSGHDHHYARHQVKYKERFWIDQQPTMFVTTNTSDKVYTHNSLKLDCAFAGEAVYEYIQQVADTLLVETLTLETATAVDTFRIVND